MCQSWAQVLQRRSAQEKVCDRHFLIRLRQLQHKSIVDGNHDTFTQPALADSNGAREGRGRGGKRASFLLDCMTAMHVGCLQALSMRSTARLVMTHIALHWHLIVAINS